MLTLYYVSTTFLQAWRIKRVCNKIAEKVAQQATVVFYTPPTEANGYDASIATSELCINRASATVSDILWLCGVQHGCCLLPTQVVHIAPWISFPDAPSWLPFAYNATRPELVDRLARTDKEDRVNLLLETEVPPVRRADSTDCTDVDVVRIEEYGKLIAWKIDSHLALLIETDLDHFAKLLMSTFLQNNLLINDHLPLIRIESIKYEGTPQSFDMVANHLRKSTRSTAELSEDDWNKHLDDLRALSILANQAIEFEYNKNLTEGKTGVIKPDLIPHEKKKKTEAVDIPAVKKAAPTSVTTSSSSSPTVVAKSPLSKASSPAKRETAAESSLKLIKNEASSSTTDVSPVKLGKLRAKPTEIKKPFAATVASDGKSKVAKVLETSSSPKPSPPETQPVAKVNGSELEKLAAASVAKVETSTQLEPNAITSKKPETEPREPQASTSKSAAPQAATSSVISVVNDNAKRPSLRRNKDSLTESKPLNILVYSDSATTRDSVTVTLKNILEKDMYTIYTLTSQQVEQKHWVGNTALLVACGSISSSIGEILVDYFLRGGRVLSLCSDILHYVLPTYRTAEVREHELVQFSYDKWQKVQMMHHIFCYQPSPVKKNFSTDSDDSAPLSRKPALVCPRSIELKDLRGDLHNLDVKILGTEETWNTPSLLLAHSVRSGGKAVFSQVHLETSPTQFETDETKYSILKKNEKIRLEILSNLLGKYLNISVNQSDTASDAFNYKNGYFLGHHESKFQLLEKLKGNSVSENVIKTSTLSMHFCGKDDKPPVASANLLPILIHSCPEDFSTVAYFDHLKTSHFGRLVIYAPIMNSSMNAINELELTHGIAVLVRQQTQGVGRSNNQWLSPLGCAMFSMQLHIPMDSQLGSRLPLLQLIVATAMVNTVKGHDDYKVLDIGIKWPNDIYANGVTKIGGLIIHSVIKGSKALVNIGCGINLDNSKPTLCINDMINTYNRLNHKSLPLLNYETFIALMFNEIERLVDRAQRGDFDYLYKLYYDLWLHSDKNITICDKDGNDKEVQIVGVDDYGFLKVKLADGSIEVVHPDGNTFDILKGLIVPKFN